MHQMHPFLHAHQSQAAIRSHLFDVKTHTRIAHNQLDIVRHATGEVGIGPAVAAMQRAFATNPARRFQVEDVIAEDDRVALRVTIHGGLTAPGEPRPMILEIFRIANGQVVEIWGAGTAPRQA